MTAAHKQRIDDKKNPKKRQQSHGGDDDAPRKVTDRFKSPVEGGPEKRSRSHGGGYAEPEGPEEEIDERYRNIDPKYIEMIQNEVLDKSPNTKWDDIAGLAYAKKCVTEMVIWPMLRPDIFSGLRAAPKGLLLFGPPGTGKTMIGRAIASESKSTFFSISASSLTSKWMGEGEKLVRALFAVARVQQPSVIFIDEIDSMLTQRNESENEGSRRIKTEFLVQWDGAATTTEDQLLVVGATNRPQELDEAARRRLVKRIYIPLPGEEARRSLVTRLTTKTATELSPEELNEIVHKSDGYSGSDLTHLCTEAALGPIRCIHDINTVQIASVRPIVAADFVAAFRQVRASVSQNDLDGLLQWNTNFGSTPLLQESAA